MQGSLCKANAKYADGASSRRSRVFQGFFSLGSFTKVRSGIDTTTKESSNHRIATLMSRLTSGLPDLGSGLEPTCATLLFLRNSLRTFWSQKSKPHAARSPANRHNPADFLRACAIACDERMASVLLLSSLNVFHQDHWLWRAAQAARTVMVRLFLARAIGRAAGRSRAT